MNYQELSPEQAAAQFWDGMRCVADAATETSDEKLFDAIRLVGEAAMATGIPIPATGEFVHCPVCNAMPGQGCINVPNHTVPDHLHPERTERARILRKEIGEHQ